MKGKKERGKKICRLDFDFTVLLKRREDKESEGNELKQRAGCSR
jgi:hypothetical protein